MTGKVEIIGHRGASSVAPPNSLKAFQKAIDLKADYIEFDLHLSKDKEIVVFHDFDLKALTGKNILVKNLLVKELKQYDVGENEQIPTLNEVIALCGKKIGLQCEVKAPGLIQYLYQALNDNDLIDSSLISSFMLSELIKLKKIDNRLNLALLISEHVKSSKILMRKISKTAKLGFFAIHPYYKLISQEFVSESHKNKLKVNAWTVNNKQEMLSLLQKGVNGIITDNIPLAKQLLIESG